MPVLLLDVLLFSSSVFVWMMLGASMPWRIMFINPIT